MNPQPAFRASHPLEFLLYDSKDQHFVLYISDDPKEEHSLTLELRNTSSLALSFPDLGQQASNEANHFALVFRANTLSPKTIGLLGSADKATALTEPGDWDVALDPQGEAVTLWFRYRGKNRVLAPGERRQVGLKWISAAAGRGARGTKVEFKPRRVSYADGTPITGSRIEHLQIISHGGSPQMPVHVGFIGSNRILNDGSSSDLKLTLQVMNIADPAAEHLADPTIRLQAGKSKFILTFDVADNETGKPEWALCKQSEFAVKATEMESKVEWKDDSAGQGNVKRLTWSPASDVTLNPGQAIEFILTGFKSSLPAGQTNLYLHYQDIPGYWDGQFVCIIEKAPLLFAGGNVGVGVAAPTRKLEIAGTEGNVLWAGASAGSTATIELSGHVELRAYDTQNVAYLQARDDSSNLDIGLRLRTQKKGDSGKSIIEAVTIDPSGNVGVGTNAPKAKLHVAGPVQIDGGDLAFDATHRAGKIILWDRSDVASNDVSHGIGTESYHNIYGAGTGFPHSIGHKFYRGGNELIAQLGFGGANTPLNRLDSYFAGNVGVGVAAPKRKLEIAGASGDVLWAGASTGGTANIELSGHVQLREYGTQNLAYLQARDDGSNRDIGLRLRTQKKSDGSTPSYTDAVTIDGSGNVGVGTAAPQAKLHVAGSIKIDGKNTLEFGAGIAGKETNAGKIGYDVGNTKALEIWGAGENVPERKIKLWAEGGTAVIGDLYCSGGIYARGGLRYYWGPDSVWKGIENTGGGAAASVNANGPSFISDIRLKSNVRPIRDALEKVIRLSGRSFRWSETGLDYLTQHISQMYSAGPEATEEDNDRLWAEERQKACEALSGDQIGLIAQEVEAVVPEVVHEDDQGYMHVKYQHLTALLIEAIKEQQTTIQSLAVEITALRKDISAMQSPLLG